MAHFSSSRLASRTSAETLVSSPPPGRRKEKEEKKQLVKIGLLNAFHHTPDLRF